MNKTKFDKDVKDAKDLLAKSESLDKAQASMDLVDGNTDRDGNVTIIIGGSPFTVPATLLKTHFKGKKDAIEATIP